MGKEVILLQATLPDDSKAISLYLLLQQCCLEENRGFSLEETGQLVDLLRQNPTLYDLKYPHSENNP